MNELARLVSLNDNLYRATQKMLSKTREGHHHRKVFEKEAKTPAQRILEDKAVPRKHRDHVKALLAENDPLDLSRRIDRAILEMWRIIRKAREDANLKSTRSLRVCKCVSVQVSSIQHKYQLAVSAR